MKTLNIENVSKKFPGTLALDNVSAKFASGKVNALIGKNGSGKSTLVKIINGVQPATSGEIYFEGEKLVFASPEEAMDKGIATVYQELSLISGMSVAENLLLGRFPMRGKFIDWDQTYKFAKDLLTGMNIDIDPKAKISNLSMWQCQMIEIAKAMSTDPKVILLDEPTSSLSKAETDILFDLIKQLKKKDVIIIYITHRLQELWEIADTCTVLRDGIYTGSGDMDQLTHKDVLKMMFGETTIQRRPESLKRGTNKILEIKNLSQGKKFNNINFDVYEGEILGIAGMLGSGRTELLRAIFGIDPFDQGDIYFDGQRIVNPTPLKMKKKGLGLTPEDRKNEGLVQIMSIKNNLCVASLERMSKGLFIDKEKEDAFAWEQVKRLQIDFGNIHAKVSSLSGGNQQKVVIGNWLNNKPRFMMFDEPTRGIDVNAKQQIFKIMWELSKEGIASIIVSSELEELLEVCHRIVIMRYGKVTGEIDPNEITIENLYSICMGSDC